MTQASSAVGAEVGDIDLTSLTDADATELSQLWAEYGVLFFRNQHLTPEQHLDFARKFAAIDVNRFFAAVEDHPEIAMVLKEPDQQENIGGGWHTDHSYDQAPARGSILLAREVPPTGGDTRFLSVAAAYEELSDGLKQTLEGLEAVHSNEHIFGADSLRRRKMGNRLANPQNVGSATHPVVVAHPLTGQKLLYVNPGFTRHFVGWTRDESLALLNYLYEHMRQERFTYQFQWEPGSIAMWDNRSTWHWALNDYQGHRRLMHRITVAGETLAAATALG